MERILSVRSFSPIEAYQIFKSKPQIADQIIFEAGILADQVEQGLYDNGDEAREHAERLFYLACIFQSSSTKAEFFKALAGLG